MGVAEQLVGQGRDRVEALERAQRIGNAESAIGRVPPEREFYVGRADGQWRLESAQGSSQSAQAVWPAKSRARAARIAGQWLCRALILATRAQARLVGRLDRPERRDIRVQAVGRDVQVMMVEIVPAAALVGLFEGDELLSAGWASVPVGRA